ISDELLFAQAKNDSLREQLNEYKSADLEFHVEQLTAEKQELEYKLHVLEQRGLHAEYDSDDGSAASRQGTPRKSKYPALESPPAPTSVEFALFGADEEEA